MNEFFRVREGKRDDLDEASTFSRSNFFQPSQPSIFKVSEEDNSLTKTAKKYLCLLIVGRPGVGKTTCLEGVCRTQGLVLEKIDCSIYESFGELKKTFSEAVKSLAVETKSAQTGNLQSFFAMKKDKEAPSKKPAMEKKVFLLTNVEHFFLGNRVQEVNIDKLIKSMVEFFDYSSFPFVIETSKTGRNRIPHNLLEYFDYVEYTRPNTDSTVLRMGIISDIESLNTLSTVQSIKRHKEREEMQGDQMFFQVCTQAFRELEISLVNQNEKVDGILQRLPLQQLKSYILAVDFNLHSCIANLSFFSTNPGEKALEMLMNSLESILSTDLLDQYRLKPEVDKAILVSRPGQEIMFKHSGVCCSQNFQTLEEAQFFLNCYLNFQISKEEHLVLPDLERIQSVCSQDSEELKYDILNAQEIIYLELLSNKVAKELAKSHIKFREPEIWHFLKSLALIQSKEKVSNHYGLRSRSKPEFHQPLKTLLDNLKCSEASPNIFKHIAKLLYPRSTEVPEER